MGVLFQAFYWNCPGEENQDGTWWNFVASKIPELQQAGITALWLPPACKAANIGGPSMGYDPYDYYDLGDINQKGRVKTWFGNQAELTALIDAAHAANMQVYADLVINHNNGGDAQETNPIDGSIALDEVQSRAAASSRATGRAFIHRRTRRSTK